MNAITELPIVRGLHARNAQNAHMQAKLADAGACLEALIRHGYTVLRIELEGAKPVVWIQGCAQCDKLIGAWYRIEGTHQGRRYTWQAPVLACRVQWQTQGEHS
ncbi:hypothetical protein [Sedimenticola hydrogenitrophicus]|uniref:hypothetical protein n=1 Tax=Sedimenticola hydrogenitrophicus TaxID=2967975 RepID=UPI0023AF8A16|nr:hypothetical protein [Sedimenticola hydrogenitrophicus]